MRLNTTNLRLSLAKLIVCGLGTSFHVWAATTSECDGLVEQKVSVVDVQFPAVTHLIKEALRTHRISALNTYFVALPGNMGSVWRHTNHNIGYDLLLDLIRFYQASGSEQHPQDYDSPVETVTFSSKEAGDDTDIIDTQEFYSEAGFARTTSGEVFVSWGTLERPTFIFLRRYGFYNDGGDFFVPFVHEVGGIAENIIAIHDDLKLPIGQMLVENRRAEYNGNRAILSIHNNLNALRLDTRFVEIQDQIVRLITGGIKSSRILERQDLQSLLVSLRRASWETVIAIKNQGDANSFQSQLSKRLKAVIEGWLKNVIVELEQAIEPELKVLEAERAKIALAPDKRIAALDFRNYQTLLRETNSAINEYFILKEAMTDITSKTSKLIGQMIALYADSFDPRILNSPFSRIGIGTGYQA